MPWDGSWVLGVVAWCDAADDFGPSLGGVLSRLYIEVYFNVVSICCSLLSRREASTRRDEGVRAALVAAELLPEEISYIELG